jgi:hypothetical protein
MGGNVGIGTSTPAYPLHIASINGLGVGRNLTDGGYTGLLIDLTQESGGAGRIQAIKYSGTEYGDLQLNPNGGRVSVPVLQITGGGDIAEPFHVSSVRNAPRPGDGTENDQRAPAVVEPGMVVSIDPDRPGQLRVANSAFDRAVAGIISGAGGVNPGMTLRQQGSIADGTHPVALTGRVYCLVDADAGGAIQPGDLLTTSNTPGHAMKVTDHTRASGAIIGKAMTSLESGRGVVLVLVSLQ